MSKTRGTFRMVDGSPLLSMYDNAGGLRTALGVTSLETTKTGELTKRPESSLVFFDKDGKVMQQLP